MRDRYVAYRRAQAELGAWREVRGDDDASIELQLRAREGSALDDLITHAAASIADLAVKLDVLRELSAGESPIITSELLDLIAKDEQGLARRSEQEGRMLALRLTLTLLLNAAAVDRESLDRTRQAVLDLIDRPDSVCSGDAELAEAARDEVRALFRWID